MGHIQVDFGEEHAYPFLYQFITWGLVLLGWYLLNRQQNNRARRQEVRVKIDRCEELLMRLEVLSIGYHTNPSHDEAIAREIRSLLNKVLRHITFSNLLSQEEYADTAKRLRQAITLRNFDSSMHTAQTLNSTIVEGIGEAIVNAQSALEVAFMNRYSQ